MEDAKIIIERYNPANLTDEQLLNDWRVVVHWYGLSKRGTNDLYTEGEIYTLSERVYNEIIDRTTEGDMHFNFKPNKMADHAREIYYKLSTKNNPACELCVLPTYEFPERRRITLAEENIDELFGKSNQLVIQKYCNGNRAMLCKSNNDIKLYVLGTGLCDSNPQIISEAQALADCDYVLEGELFDGKFIITDTPYFGEAIHELPWTDRRKLLNKVNHTTHIRGSYPFIVDDIGEFKELVSVISNTPNAKGVLVFKDEIVYGDKKLELITYGTEETSDTQPNTEDSPTD